MIEKGYQPEMPPGVGGGLMDPGDIESVKHPAEPFDGP
jgi:hypothetical protein